MNDYEFVELKTSDDVVSVVKGSNPDKQNKCGFWLFDEAFKKSIDLYLTINEYPLNLRYFAIRNKDGDNVALASFCKFHFDEFPEYKEYLHLMDVQVDRKFKVSSMFSKIIFPSVESYAKSEEYSGLSLQCYERRLEIFYSRLGFIKPFENENLMILTF